MIRLKVITVSRHRSSEIRTMHFTYKGDVQTAKQAEGGEWEEVEFMVDLDDKPVIRVGNMDGDAFFVHAPIKLVINNPALFNTYKVGDLVQFTPEKEVKKESLS